MEVIASDNTGYIMAMKKKGANQYNGVAEPLIAYLATFLEQGATSQPEVQKSSGSGTDVAEKGA